MTQDPALFEDSPSIRAAVAEERRIGSIEADIKAILTMVNSIDGRVAIQNGRVTTLEKSLETVRDGLSANEQRLKDRRLWERLDNVESWRKIKDNETSHDQGVVDGKVSLRAGDKVGFGMFMTILGLLMTIAIKLT